MKLYTPRSSSPGFTLIEILLVMVIIVVIAATAAPAVQEISQATNLSNAGDLVLNRLSEAQQLAIASDTEVEVRLIEETAADEVDSASRIRSMQVYTLAPGNGEASEEGFLEAGPPVKLPSGVVISQNEKLTALVSTGYDTLPAGRRCLKMRFFPDGSTSLRPGSLWFLTVAHAAEDKGGIVPSNYYTVQIDAATGRLRTFRP